MLGKGFPITKEVQVIELERGWNPLHNALMNTISLGYSTSLDDKQKARFEAAGQKAPNGPIGVKTLVLNLEFEGAVPYRMGSKWSLTVSADGGITLTEMKD